MRDYIDQFCSKISKDRKTIIINEYRGRRSYSIEELLKDLERKNLLEVSLPTIKKAFRSIIKDTNRGTRAWLSYILQNYTDFKQCSRCKVVKLKIYFTKSNSELDKLDNRCKDCKSLINKDWHKNNYESYRKAYIDIHRSDYVARNAKRRSIKLSATPKWSNLEKIREIYNNCPKGYHVDHIIPLQGKNVCGLHVENNLQYLTKSNNLAKGNKFESYT